MLYKCRLKYINIVKKLIDDDHIYVYCVDLSILWMLSLCKEETFSIKIEGILILAILAGVRCYLIVV